MAVEIRREEFTDKKNLRQEIEGKLNYLVSARPTAVNMKIAAEDLITLSNQLSKDESVSASEMKEKYGIYNTYQIHANIILKKEKSTFFGIITRRENFYLDI